MKILTIQQLRELDDKKLLGALAEVSRLVMETQMLHRQEQLKDSSLLKKYRRYRARLRTIRRQQALGRVLPSTASSVPGHS